MSLITEQGEEIARLTARVKELEQENALLLAGHTPTEMPVVTTAGTLPKADELTVLRAACAKYREASERAIEFAEGEAYCPCCEGVKQCEEGCTIKEDCERVGGDALDRYNRMLAARMVLALTPDSLRGLTAVPENTVYLNGQVLINAQEVIELREMEEYCGLLEEECSSEQLSAAQKRFAARTQGPGENDMKSYVSATVTEVTREFVRVREDISGTEHVLVNGSLNVCPGYLQTVGERGFIYWITTPDMNLPFFTDHPS